MKKKRDASPLGQGNIFVCLLVFVCLITGLLHKTVLGKYHWDRCKVLRVKS